MADSDKYYIRIGFIDWLTSSFNGEGGHTSYTLTFFIINTNS